MENQRFGITVASGAHKHRKTAPRSVQQCMIAGCDVLTAAARLWPYLAHRYVTTATEAT